MSRDLTKYTPLLHKIAGEFPEHLRDDLVQEGYLALYRASELFDETRGVPFTSYAYKEVFGTMNRFVKDVTGSVSLDRSIEEEDGNITTYADILEDTSKGLVQQQEDKEYYDMNLAGVTPIERFIKQRHFEEGMTPQEIIELYYELHLISDVRTIKKILKK